MWKKINLQQQQKSTQLLESKNVWSDIVVCALIVFNPSTKEAEAGGFLWAPGQPALY